MTLVFTLLTIAVLGLVVAVALGWIGGGLDAPTSSLPPTGLPDGDLAPQDLERVRFTPALRGYRMDQVDEALDRVAGELARRDEEIEQLQQSLLDLRTGGVGGASAEVYRPDPYASDLYPPDIYRADVEPTELRQDDEQDLYGSRRGAGPVPGGPA